jgi:preprotein translocase subunit YajC
MNFIRELEIIIFAIFSGIFASVLLFLIFLYLLYKEDKRDFKETLKDL